MHQFLRRRHTKLRSAMKRAKVGALLVVDPTNIRYLTDLECSAGCMLVTPKNTVLFVDARHTEMARERAAFVYDVLDVSLVKERVSSQRRVWFDPSELTVERLDRWKRRLKNTKFVQVKSLLQGLRRVKDAEEIRRIRRACSITKAVLRLCPSLLTIGITERELSWTIESECRRRGAEGMAFESIVAFGRHTSRPHHRCTDTPLKAGDIVQIDMGATYRGYYSDFSRVFFTGSRSAEQKKAYRALKEAKKSAELLLKHGAVNRALDAAAREVLLSYGYDKEFCHALGHGVGLEIHEGISISRQSPKEKLLRGEVVTIEPGLYFPGEFGMRIEDTYVVP